jgi:hypothetical protein
MLSIASMAFHQIDEHLLQLTSVAHDKRQLRGQADVGRYSAIVELFMQRLQHVARQLTNIDLLFPLFAPC